MLALGVMKRQMPLPRLVFREESQMFQFLMVILKNTQWDETVNNKLHEIHPQLDLWPRGSRIIRREESVLARVRIGHTHLTHCFRLKGEDPPKFTACDCQLTVKHILFECIDFIESRNRHFSVNSFRELFEKVPPDSILSDLHEIGLFYRL